VKDLVDVDSESYDTRVCRLLDAFSRPESTTPA
jgi:hypothetical protein